MRLWLGKDLKIEWSPILSLRFYTTTSGRTIVVPAIGERASAQLVQMLGGSGSFAGLLILLSRFFVEIIFSSPCCFVFWKVFVIVHPLFFFFFFCHFFSLAHHYLHKILVFGCVGSHCVLAAAPKQSGIMDCHH